MDSSPHSYPKEESMAHAPERRRSTPPLSPRIGWRLSSWCASLALLLLLACGPPAAAQGEPLRPPVLVIEDLLGSDYRAAKRARRELIQIGARAVPAILEARSKPDLPYPRRQTLDAALYEILDLLAATIEAGITAQAESSPAQGALGGASGSLDPGRSLDEVAPLQADQLGDLGSVSGELPSEAAGKRARGRRARGAVLFVGPAATGPLLRVPPLRDPGLGNVLRGLAGRIYLRERELALACESAAEKAAFSARYAGISDLASPVIAAGIRDEQAAVRALFQGIRDAALARALAGLDAQQPDARRRAEDELLRLAEIASLSLQAIAEGRDPQRQSPHARASATRLLRWIRYGLDAELVRKLGHDMADYSELEFRERRARVFEIGRLGGAEAIPCLRALLREEPSLQVKLAAAVGLLRQQDPLGAEWFARHGQGLPRLGLSKRELAAIHMDMGLRHLTEARFQRAEREFTKVLEVEPRNEIAWYNLACTYSRWQKVEQALEALQKAIECGFDDTKHMRDDPDLDNIREDPRFKAMIEKIERERAEDGDEDAQPEERPE